MTGTDVDMRLYALHRGIVTDASDPKGLGRVRVMIPGFIEPESEWAMPVGGISGEPGEGFYAVPSPKTHVIVFFNGGDVDSPYYMAGPWTLPKGETKVPTEIATAIAEDGPDVSTQLRVFETKSFVLTFDERADNQFLQLRHKASGDVLEVDGKNRGIRIAGTTAVVIEAAGFLKLNGLAVSINGRPVMPGSKPI